MRSSSTGATAQDQDLQRRLCTNFRLLQALAMYASCAVLYSKYTKNRNPTLAEVALCTAFLSAWPSTTTPTSEEMAAGRLWSVLITWGLLLHLIPPARCLAVRIIRRNVLLRSITCTGVDHGMICECDPARTYAYLWTHRFQIILNLSNGLSGPAF